MYFAFGLFTAIYVYEGRLYSQLTPVMERSIS